MRNKIAKKLRRHALKMGINVKDAKRLWKSLPKNAKTYHIIPQMLERVFFPRKSK